MTVPYYEKINPSNAEGAGAQVTILITCIMAPLIVLCLLAASAGGHKIWSEQKALRDHGKTTDGYIVRLVSTQGRGESYHAWFKYPVQESGKTRKSVINEEYLTRDEFYSLRQGQTVRVIYDREDIWTSRLVLPDGSASGKPGRDPAGVTLGMAAAVCATAALIIGLGTRQLRKIRDERAARRLVAQASSAG